MRRTTMLSFAVLAAMGAAAVVAQKLPGSLPGKFDYVPKADVEKVQQSIEDGATPNDAPVRMVDVGGKYNIGVYTLNSPVGGAPKPGAPVLGFYHLDIAEVYYIASGSGHWRVGGELVDPKWDDVTLHPVKEVRGPGAGGVLKGFTNQEIHAGDVLIIPPGVPHSPGEMMERTKIVRIVIDAHKSLPLHGANGQNGAFPALKQPTGTPPANLPGAWTFIPKADIDRVLKEEETPGPTGDRPVRTVDLPGFKSRVGVYVLHGTKASDNVPKVGWYHNNIAEVYTFLRGAGTFVIGGELENPAQDDANSVSTKLVRGPSVSGTFKGQTEQKMEPGDWLIAPTGVPHVPGKVTGVPRDILRIAIDPDRVLPLK